MSKTPQLPPLYQRYSDSGTRIANRAGVVAALKTGDDAKSNSVTWLVSADSLGEMTPLPVYDYLRDGNGNWWTVAAVGELDGGNYPLLCTRWTKGTPS